MRFFKLDKGVLILDKDEIKLYKHFRTILERDRGGKIRGDADGRYKYFAFAEFSYIYFLCDINAIPAKRGFSASESHAFAIKESNLPKDYTPDEVVIEAMEFYREHCTTPTTEILIGLERGYHVSAKVINSMVEKINESFDNISIQPKKTTIRIKGEESVSINNEQANIDIAIGYLKQLNILSKDLPNIVENLKKVRATAETEQAQKQSIQGGKVKASRMDPK